MKTAAHSNPPLGQRASDLEFVRDLVQTLWDEMVCPPLWAFEDMQAAGEEEMRIAGRVYECELGAEMCGDLPLTVWARPRILEACKRALKGERDE